MADPKAGYLPGVQRTISGVVNANGEWEEAVSGNTVWSGTELASANQGFENLDFASNISHRDESIVFDTQSNIRALVCQPFILPLQSGNPHTRIRFETLDTKTATHIHAGIWDGVTGELIDESQEPFSATSAVLQVQHIDFTGIPASGLPSLVIAGMTFGIPSTPTAVAVDLVGAIQRQLVNWSAGISQSLGDAMAPCALVWLTTDWEASLPATLNFAADNPGAPVVGDILFASLYNDAFWQALQTTT